MVKINLWEQGNEQKRFAVAAISKSYQDKRSGQWREGKNFSAKDMERLQQMLPLAQQELSKWNEYYREANKQHAQQQTPLQEPVQTVLVHQTEPLQSHPMQAMPAQQSPALTAQRPADIVQQHQQQMIDARNAAMQAAQASQQQTNTQAHAPTQTQEPTKSRP